MIKKTSWHYRMANFGNRRVWPGDRINFCQYFWSVVFGSLQFLLLALSILFLIVWTGFSVTNIVQWFLYDTPLSQGTQTWVILFGALLGAVITMVTVIGTMQYRQKRAYENFHKKEVEPGFFTLAYRKWKEKTCHIIKVED